MKTIRQLLAAVLFGVLLLLCAMQCRACNFGYSSSYVGCGYAPQVAYVQAIAAPQIQYVAVAAPCQQTVVAAAAMPCAQAEQIPAAYSSYGLGVSSYGVGFNSYGVNAFNTFGYGSAFFGRRAFFGRSAFVGVGDVNVIVGGRRGFFGGRTAVSRSVTRTRTRIR